MARFGGNGMNEPYGQYNETDKHAIAARIWGHRLRSGQHWMEYLLEFLSVLAGFDYQFGQGHAARDDDPSYQQAYRIPKRLGLRRFVFYDDHEKTPDDRDRRATDEIRLRLRRHLPADAPDAEELLAQLRSLLRSYSAIEDARSWYAKSLFPIHEEFLLWEALRKRAPKRNGNIQDSSYLALPQLDDDIDFFARNFFARGGELYYLMISAGTEAEPERRARIGLRLHALLTERNHTLGQFARLINNAWNDLLDDQDTVTEGHVGWLPDPLCPLYRQFAEDLDIFLDNNLDSIECLELLAHLIGFHIVSYIYHRANPASASEGHESGSCMDACRPLMLIDLLGNEENGVIRERSAVLLRRHDAWQLDRVREVIYDQVREWAEREPDDRELYVSLKNAARDYFLVGRKRAQGNYESALREVQARYEQRQDRDVLVHDFAETVFGALSVDFRTNFLAVHSKLGRAIGLIAPRKGPSPRFVLSDTLLKTLVVTNLRPGAAVSFGELLERLYQRYGMIVGPGEARDSGLLESLRINEEYYAHNRDALLNRMKRAGLVTQYSDATALVNRL